MSFPPLLPAFTDPGQNILISHNGQDPARLNIQDLVLLKDLVLLNVQDLVLLNAKVRVLLDNKDLGGVLLKGLPHLLLEVVVVLICVM